MKLPNGFGSITRLSGNRRKPYVVKKSVDKKQIIIGYGASYTEALDFLVAYNHKPAFYGNGKMTFEKLYSLFKSEKWPGVSDATRSGYENAYRHCEVLHNQSFSILKLADLQDVISNVGKRGAGYSTQKKIRNLFHQLYRYAIKYDLCDKDYSLYVTIAKDDKHKLKQPFTIRQIRKLAKTNTPFSELVLMLIYTGLRPSEFLRLKPSDIFVQKRCLIVRQSKTQAGRNRLVPIHDCVWPLFAKRLNQPKFVEISSYTQFRERFKELMKEVHMKHTPYECRHTLATMLDDAGANKLSIKRILGHASGNVTDKHYIHKNLMALRKAIKLLPSCY